MKPFIKKYWLPDLILAGALSALAVCISLMLWSQVRDLIIPSRIDFWFGGDSPRVFENLINFRGDHYRTSVHPLFSLLIATPTIMLLKLGLSKVQAVTVEMAVAAALAPALLYWILRVFLPRLDATVYTLLFLSSAGFMFWFSVPETFAWGSVSVLLALLAGAVIPRGRHAAAVVLASAFSLSMTLTNWMAGLMAALVSQPWRTALRSSVYAFALVALLTPVQYLLFPSAGKFLNVGAEQKFMRSESVHTLPANTATFFVNAVVAPKFEIFQLKEPDQPPRPTLSALTASIGSGGVYGIVAAVAWVGLLLLGLRALAANAMSSRIAFIVATVVAGQFILHLFYGDGPFLYAAHYVPLLIVIAGFASKTKLRPLALGLAITVGIAGGINNLAMFEQASGWLQTEAGR